MTDSTKFIDLAFNGKPVQFRNAFDELMKDKLANVLDRTHNEVVASMRGVEVEDIERAQQEVDQEEEQLTPEEEVELDADEDI